MVAAAPLPELASTATWLADGSALRVLEVALDRAVPLHWHEFFELSHVRSGGAVHHVNGEVQQLGPGDTLLLTPADFHALAPGEQGLATINVIFAHDAVPAEARDGLLPALRGCRVHAPALAGDFARLVAEAGGGRQDGRLALQATLTRILVDVARADGGGATAPPPTGLHGAIVWIEHHFRGRVTLAEAAARAHLSPNHFSTCFRRATGLPFQEYVQRRRLHFARGLLRASQLPVTEVCHASGFNDLSHFTRSYRRLFSRPPSADRRALSCPEDRP